MPFAGWRVEPIRNGSSATTESDGEAALRIAPAFTERFYDILSPGSTIVVTDDPALPDADPNFTIIANDS